MNWFKKFISWLKGLATRPGLDTFLSQYIDLAKTIIARLAEVNNNQGFDQWKDQAWKEVQAATGELRGTWIAILIHIAYEHYKARK